MEDRFQSVTQVQNSVSGVADDRKKKDCDEEEYDTEAWETLSKNFREAQSVLDQNRVLIQKVNENHQSKIHDNLVKNVALIKEINCNVSKVKSLYSDLSIYFTNIVHQRRAGGANSKNSSEKAESAES